MQTKEEREIQWKEVTKKLAELKPFEINQRDITEKGLEDLTASINKFGLAEPIIINTDCTIIGGHARYSVLKKQGADDCQCYIPNRELRDEEVKELNVRLNKNIAGNWDYELLVDEFDLDALIDWGFGKEEFELRDTINIVNSDDEEWIGMPEFEKPDSAIKLIVNFEKEEDRNQFCDKYSLKPQKSSDKTWSLWYPEKAMHFSSNSLKYE